MTRPNEIIVLLLAAMVIAVGVWMYRVCPPTPEVPKPKAKAKTCGGCCKTHNTSK